MKLNATYIKIRDKWWGLPLFLPSLILPIFAHINTFAHISSGEVFLFYLPLALMISMMMFFSWAALPGIALGIFVRKYAELGFYETLSLTANFIIIIILCWGGYRVFTPRRNNVSHGDTRLISQRIFWQIVFPATLFLILFQFAAFVGLLASRENLVGVMPFNLGTLINYQALLVGNLIGVPLCYFIIRVVRNPFYLRSYYSQLKQQVDAKVTKKEFALWLLALGALLLLLCMPLNEKSTIFSTNYTLSLLLPLMMWGAMRYGYKLISLLWAVVLMISIHSYQNYIPIYPGYTTQLTITSSSYLVFSFIVNYMAVLATRQRAVVRRIQRLAYVDFTGVARMLAGRVYDAGNPFSASISITVEDMLPEPQTAVSDAYSISEAAPEFSFSAVSTDAWARSIRGMEISYAKGNPDVLKLQYRPAAGGEWADAVLSSDNGSVLSFDNITGLTPSTEYELRAIYNGNGNTAVTAALTTEEAAQVGNSGFEEWTDAIHEVDGWSSTDKVNWYLPWKDASSAVWAVNSKVSMPDSYNAAYLSYKCHPTVSYLNTDAYEKTNYAQIVTVAVGAAASEWSNGTSYYGELFIGSATDDGKYETTGTTFHSRPDKLAFYYKYSSYEKEQFYVHAEVRKSDGTVIATAHTDAGPASVGWTRYEMPFTYSDSTSESASIFIAFRSTSSSSPKVRKMTIQEIGGSYTIHGGSILCVDDLQLIYE